MSTVVAPFSAPLSETFLPPVSEGNMYTLPGEGDLDKLAHDPSVPMLFFTGILYQEIRYLVTANASSEFAVFLKLARIDQNRPHFLAHDFYMPKQEASSASVKLNVQDCLEFYERERVKPYFKANGLHRHLCHFHSHAGFGANWSGVDKEQQNTREDLGFMDDFRFYVVMNAKGDATATFVTYNPVLTRTEAALGISFADESHCRHLSKLRKAELEKLWRERVAKPSIQFGHNPEFATQQKREITPGKTVNEHLSTKAESGYSKMFQSIQPPSQPPASCWVKDASLGTWSDAGGYPRFRKDAYDENTDIYQEGFSDGYQEGFAAGIDGDMDFTSCDTGPNRIRENLKKMITAVTGAQENRRSALADFAFASFEPEKRSVAEADAIRKNIDIYIRDLFKYCCTDSFVDECLSESVCFALEEDITPQALWNEIKKDLTNFVNSWFENV